MANQDDTQDQGKQGQGDPNKKDVKNTDDLKGRAKEAAGSLTGDENLKEEGQVDQGKGDVKDSADKLKAKVNRTIDRATDKLVGDDEKNQSGDQSDRNQQQ